MGIEQTNSKKGILYLIPNTLGEASADMLFPAFNGVILKQLKHFIVEDVRTVRRFLRWMDREADIDSMTFYTLNKHTRPEEISTFLAPLSQGYDMGVISEAGCPCIADPGAEVVKIAQRKGIKVVPLVGPSSILLGLMASGFNGQSFAFVGYLPIENDLRVSTLKKLEDRAAREHQSQLFIETPYRNMKMVESILHTLKGDTMLCIACDVTLETQYIVTRSVSEWKSSNIPDLNKRPSIFIIYR